MRDGARRELQILYALVAALAAEGWAVAGPQFEALAAALRMPLPDLATRCARCFCLLLLPWAAVVQGPGFDRFGARPLFWSRSLAPAASLKTHLTRSNPTHLSVATPLDDGQQNSFRELGCVCAAVKGPDYREGRSYTATLLAPPRGGGAGEAKTLADCLPKPKSPAKGGGRR